MKTPSYESMNEALDLLSAYGPDLRNGMTSHAPMAAEAMCALGRPDAVLPWLEKYRKGMLPRDTARERIHASEWRAALGRLDRVPAWSAFFEEELCEAPWGDVLDRWTARLAPGICASATHGVIRVGHAVRSLAREESLLRRRELADGLGYWAANYQELPTADAPAKHMTPAEAIAHVALFPREKRQFADITSSLAALNDLPDFAPAISFVDIGGDFVALASALKRTFADVFLANAHDALTAIVFVHGVTSVAALGNMLPHLSEATGREALRYAWQAGAALYAAWGSQPRPLNEIPSPPEDVDTLADRAIAHGDEHAIKFAEAALGQYASDHSNAYVSAVWRACELLQRA